MRVKFNCPSCDAKFANLNSFATPYYHCEECSEYWPKEDGRNCPQCHKFGRNTEMPVCDGCQTEVEDFEGDIDPDTETVMDENGNEIISKKKAQMRKTNQQKSEEARAASAKMFEAQQKILTEACAKRGFVDKNRFDELILGTKTVWALGQPVTISIKAHVDFAIHCTEPPPYRLEFRLKVTSEQGGWDGFLLPSERFEDLDVMFTRVKELMKEPFRGAQT